MTYALPLYIAAIESGADAVIRAAEKLGTDCGDLWTLPGVTQDQYDRIVLAAERMELEAHRLLRIAEQLRSGDGK